MIELKPNLFGLNNTNRDFSLKETWGKNQFNSSFPASLCGQNLLSPERRFDAIIFNSPELF